MSAFKYEKDADGIVTLTMDQKGPVNAMNAEYRAAMGEAIERLAGETGLKGVVITSAKKTFFAGGDLNELLAVVPGTEAAFFTGLQGTKAQFRRLEKLQVPVVAAINGAALGGGFELALACNRRIMLDKPGSVVALPEVSLGLLPGGGGVVRLVHLIGLQKALPYLLEGTRVKPQAALKAGLVDEVVSTLEELVPAAKAWINAHPTAHEQPWDRKGHQVPGGSALSLQLSGIVTGAMAMLEKKTRGLLPAPERVLAVAQEATLLDFDAALRVESRALTYLVTTPQAKNIINTMFFQLNEVNGGGSRPVGFEKTQVRKVGIVGAGMMGQGIAYVSAMAGIEVVLRDVSMEAAQKGKAYSEGLLAAAVAKGRMDAAKKDATLALIKPTAQVEDLKGCDLIIEAVFENADLKNQVTRETEPLLAQDGVFGTNTSTLPISLLAKAARRPENFIGIHFFSPVDKMPLIEIICGEKTSDATLAKAFDYARQIGKTAIVVNDVLGFFTSRTFGSYLDEGVRLLLDGVDPVVIENSGRHVGMPVGPLAMQDEVSQQLAYKVKQTHEALGVLYSVADTRGSSELCERMVTEFGRGGRHHGGGYYEYQEDGNKRIWPRLYELFHKQDVAMSEADIKDRLLFRQVIEAIRCLQEGVLRSVADGNVGSVLGIGAPVWTGGFLQFVNTYGLDRFVKRSHELSGRYGERFAPPELLLRKAKAGEAF
ncbi:3-hydroxyacyl-CoA dehydrogenase NAD-binding domain-containing protein [Ideonella sp. B508-1]|uniref:3-hydroxyacyl-CoA dehydrogenase NAD-binding domain-containing protein n=1 Tax=Ideonella sp. B508-1 TaxID=137716 RepID=UPI000347A6BE|nr:3-hydroxyacyl-CoA dehydrogenase NAD-binding domain-containing protein [Ideonella sp. B508-1]